MDESVASPVPPQAQVTPLKKKMPTWLKVLIGGALVIFGIPVLYIVAILLAQSFGNLFYKDISFISDSDLALTPISVEKVGQAHTVLMELENLEDPVGDKTADIFARAHRAGVYQDPLLLDLATYSANQEIPPLDKFRKGGKRIGEYALSMYRQDASKAEQSIEQIISVLWVANKIENSRSHAVDQFVSIAMTDLAAKDLITFAREYQGDGMLLRQSVLRIRDAHPDPRGLVESVKVEYVSEKAFLLGVQNGESNGWVSFRTVDGKPTKFMYHPNETINTAAEIKRRHIDEYARECHAFGSQDTIEKSELAKDMDTSSLFSVWLIPNGVGNYLLYNLYQYSVMSTKYKHCNAVASFRAAEAILDIRGGELLGEGLPKSLDFYRAIDPYTNTSFIYRPEVREIRSVGRDRLPNTEDDLIFTF